MTMPVRLLSTATAVPPHLLTQRDAAAAAHQGFASRYDDFRATGPGVRKLWDQGSGSRCGRLHSYLEPLGWPERNAAFPKGRASSSSMQRRGALAPKGSEQPTSIRL